MILDSLHHIERYSFIGPQFSRCIQWLKDKPEQREDGKYELSDDVYAIVQRYQTKPQEQGRWEAHRKYTDLQVMLTGSERMGWSPIENCSSIDPYNIEKDVEFFTGNGQMILVPDRHFTVFFPHDVHMPTIHAGSPAPVLKVVFKIALAK